MILLQAKHRHGLRHFRAHKGFRFGKVKRSNGYVSDKFLFNIPVAIKWEREALYG